MPTVISGTTLNALTTVSWGVMSLFANNEQGVWFDPSDLNNYMSGLGPELVTNGDFNNGLTGWGFDNNWTAVNGTASVTANVAGSNLYQTITSVVAGRWYAVSFEIISVAVSTLRMDALGSGDNWIFYSPGASGKKTVYVLAQNNILNVAAYGNTVTVVDNISVKELTTISSATMFQDTAGTTPVTAVEQPVGLILDKSKGLAGAELMPTSSSGWLTDQATISDVSGGVIRVTNTGNNGEAYKEFTTVIGRSYSYSVQRLGGTSNGAYYFSTTAPSSFTGSLPYDNGAASGLARGIFIANATTTYLRIEVSSSTNGQYHDYIVSVKEIPGNHASQATSTSRPVLSARVNLATYTETFTNNVWLLFVGATKTGVSSTTVSFASATNSQLYQELSGNIVANSYKLSIEARAITAGKKFRLKFFNGAADQLSSDLSPTSSWQRFEFTTTSVALTGGSNFGFVNESGGGTGDIEFRFPDLRVANTGVNLPPYQRVSAVTSTTYPGAVTGVPDYDTNGFPLYLRFDGVDDMLATGTIDFTATDKMSVFAGHRIVSGTGSQLICELGQNGYATSGFAFAQGPVAATSGLGFLMNAGGAIAGQTADKSLPYTSVSSLLLDSSKSGISNEVILRSNTAIQTFAITDGNTDSGTANFPNKNLYIGNRSGAAVRLNGHLYNLIIRGALSNSVDITNTEAYINSKTKAY